MKAPRARINGEWHECIVLKITGRDDQGRPASADIVYPEQSVSVQDGTEFVTAFVMSKVIGKRS